MRRATLVRLLVGLLLVAATLYLCGAQAGLRTAEIPTFQLRARALPGAVPASAARKLTFRFEAAGTSVSAPPGAWSDWLRFDRSSVEATLRQYPATERRAFPLVVILRVEGVVDPTPVEAELRFDEDGRTASLHGELFGPTLGVLVWRDESRKPQAGTMAEYNQRYWRLMAGAQVPAAERPRRFPIIDRFIGGDDDRRNWREGIQHLARAGMSAVMLPPSRPIRNLLLEAGLRRTAWAVYNPPGYAFEFGDPRTPATDATEIAAWAAQQARSYGEAGYAREEMALFAMSDEPAWYFPESFRPLTRDAAALARFREYLKVKKLLPSDVGKSGWDEVLPIGFSQARDLPARRLFYWTTRFFAWDSSRHFARCTRALEKAFYPGLPVLTNWNFFSGRFYVPGPVANNPDKTSPDAAMGGQDWSEFGRLRGGTALWTEDWFPDSQAYQWSLYSARLRSAAAKSGVTFGGYIIPRTAGDREDGILQKILCLIGSGAKAIEYFVFGPEYNFPGNCYSERAQVLRKMAEAHRLIGKAEDLLWPGERPRAEVAILAPRSAQVWDPHGAALTVKIQDATNTQPNRATVEYMAEAADLYLALQHQNIPVDFADEEDLTPQGLTPYRVLYVTAPNVPEEGQRAIAGWVRAGGTLVTVTGAGTRGRYNEPCPVLSDFTGIAEEPRQRLLVLSLSALAAVGEGQGALGRFTAVGARGSLTRRPDQVEATFADGTPAVVRRQLGKGRTVHFTWLPGLSYARSSSDTRDRLPVGFSAAIRRWIVYPTRLADVRPPVIASQAMVETPLLRSSGGAVVTLLNWTGEPLEPVSVSVRIPFEVRQVTSMRRGPLPFRRTQQGASFSLRLEAADIITLRP
jgi:hypothetical protein